MTFIFGHLIITWFFGKGIELFTKRKLNSFSWILLLIGGLLPDFDYPIAWILGIDIHRTFTHSLVFILVTFFIASLVFMYHKNKENYAFILSLGVLTHVLVDLVSNQGVPLFWPLNYYISVFGISLGKSNVSMLSQNLAGTLISLKLAIVDMILGASWVFYLGIKGRIKF